MSASEFRCLSWLPEPELDIANPGHYKPFHEVYRNAQPNPNQFVPSLLLGPDNVDGRGTFKIANLKGKILCTNCQKPRCVFLKEKALRARVHNWRLVIELIGEETIFVCGGELVTRQNSEYFEKLVTNPTLTCEKYVEGTYVQCKSFMQFVHLVARLISLLA